MSKAKAFERYWVEFERPGRPDAESVPPTPELAGFVATAVALRQHGEAIPSLDLETSWQALAARLEAAPVAGTTATDPTVQSNGHRPSASVTALRPRPRPRWTVRIAAAAVAAMMALAVVSLRATPGSALYPLRLSMERVAEAIAPNGRSIRLRVAEARLDDLLVSLRRGPAEAAPGLAGSLVSSMSAAGRAGADLTDLDRRIWVEVPAALANVPTGIAAAVRSALGSLLPPPETPAPTPSAAAPPTARSDPSDDPGARRDRGPKDGGDSRHQDDQGEQREGGGGGGQNEGSDQDQRSGGGQDEGGDGGSSGGSNSQGDRNSGHGQSGD